MTPKAAMDVLRDPAARDVLRDETLARAYPVGLARYDMGQRYDVATWLRVLNADLVDLYQGRIDRLMVSVPPQHGKSTLISQYFPAWWLGNRPKDHVIGGSYAASLATTFGRKARDTLARHGRSEQGGTGVFDTAVNPDVGAKSDWETVDGGGMVTAGVGGGITGRSAHLGIVDDPHKDMQDARSQAVQEATWDWYTSVFVPRIQEGGVQVLVMTRWSRADLAGMILRNEEEAAKWRIRVFTALAEEDDPLGRAPGEALMPSRYSRAALLDKQATVGPTVWAAEYMGSPVPEGGALFKRRWLRYYTKDGGEVVLHDPEDERRLPVHNFSRFATMDLASSESDRASYTVLCVWLLSPDADLVLWDMYRERIETTLHRDLFYQATREHDLPWTGIEEKQAGINLVQGLKQEGFNVRPLKAEKDKVTRAYPAQARMSLGKIYLPMHAPWRSVVEDEVLDFPGGAHTDIVDNFSYACILVQEGLDAEASTVRSGEKPFSGRRGGWEPGAHYG